MNKRILYLTAGSFLLFAPVLLSQQTVGEAAGKNKQSVEDAVGRLPFPISEQKRISDEELSKKKEGWFPTGIGGPFSDPNNGSGFGGRLFLFNNGKKDDPFFAYTPYRQRIFLNLSNTTKKAQYHELNFDAPYFLDTQWRVRGNLVYDRNPNNLYFGLGESSLNGLNYRDRNELGQPLTSNGIFSEYERASSYRRDTNSPNEILYTDNPYTNTYLNNTYPALQNQKITDKKYHRYDLEATSANLSGERSYFDGLVRLVVGSRLSKNRVRTYDGTLQAAQDPFYGNTPVSLLNIDIPTVQGKTKLTEDNEAKLIRGLNGGYVNSVRVGMVYDSRDYEPDPSRGIFAEATHERSMKQIGSDYNFNRTFGSVRFFYRILPDTLTKNRLVLATRFSMVNTTGDAPFFEYRNMWGTEGSLSGLGGRTTLRGYIQDRYVGPVMGFGNIELRYRLFELPGFTFNIAPLFDFGRPWDKIGNVDLKDYKYSYGVGLRIIWNQSTVIYFEWAKSRETENFAKGPFAGSNFYLNFGHIF
jgi:hypothetical protein